MKNKLIFEFSKNKSDGDSSLDDLLGGKGANLAEMSNMGIPVPPGFTITTEVCNYFTENKKLPNNLHNESVVYCLDLYVQLLLVSRFLQNQYVSV